MPTAQPTIEDLEAAARALEETGDRETRRALLARVLTRDDRLAVLTTLAERLPGPAFLTLFLAGLEDLAALSDEDFAALHAEAGPQAAHHLGNFLVLVGGVRGDRLRALTGHAPTVIDNPAFADALAGVAPTEDEDMRLQVYARWADIEIADIHRFREALRR